MSPILSFVRVFVRSFDRSFVRSLFVRSFDRSFVRSFFRSFIHSFIHSFVRSFVRSFVHLSPHSFLMFFYSDIDEGQTRPCQKGGICENIDGAYTCKYDAGYGGMMHSEEGEYMNPSLEQFYAIVEI